MFIATDRTADSTRIFIGQKLLLGKTNYRRYRINPWPATQTCIANPDRYGSRRTRVNILEMNNVGNLKKNEDFSVIKFFVNFKDEIHKHFI